MARLTFLAKHIPNLIPIPERMIFLKHFFDTSFAGPNSEFQTEYLTDALTVTRLASEVDYYIKNLILYTQRLETLKTLQIIGKFLLKIVWRYS